MDSLFSASDLALLQGPPPVVVAPIPGSPVVAGKLEVPGGGLESPLVRLPPASKFSNLISLFCKPVGETKLLY
jgi:hypothetical protein